MQHFIVNVAVSVACFDWDRLNTYRFIEIRQIPTDIIRGGSPESTAVRTCICTPSIETLHRFVRVKQVVGPQSCITRVEYMNFNKWKFDNQLTSEVVLRINYSVYQ